jgi:hypothetical protein
MGAGTPQALALVICDTVIDDRTTGKKTLVGIFNNIASQKVPVRHPELHVFVSLTDGNGVYGAKLECRHRDSGEKVFELKGDIRFDDPNGVVELNFALHGIVFSKFGMHSFDFYCDDKIVSSRKFMVSPKQTKSDVV